MVPSESVGHKSQVLPGWAKLSASITATAARWPSMAPYRGASGHQGPLNTLASCESWSPPNAVHH